MKLVCLLSWFDEDPAWLTEMVESLALADVDHLVALDGAYSLFPGAAASSHPDQQEAIAAAARKIGIHFTIKSGYRIWETEMEKRTTLFALAERVTSPDDWYLVLDADCVVKSAPTNLKRRLAGFTTDAVRVTMDEPFPPTGKVKSFPLRSLFRAIRGLHVERNHYTYVTPDGRQLWGRVTSDGRELRRGDASVRAGEVDLRVEHRTHLREVARAARARSYYAERDRLGVEVGDCDRCGQPGTREVPAQWEETAGGAKAARWLSVCDRCLSVVRAENDRELRAFGLPSDLAQVAFDKVIGA